MIGPFLSLWVTCGFGASILMLCIQIASHRESLSRSITAAAPKQSSTTHTHKNIVDTTPAFCLDDLDCSLNGVCQQDVSACLCDKPWSGDHCEHLRFLPVSFPQGYGMVPNVTSWGAGILRQDEEIKATGCNETTYHMYVSRMTNECLLEHWKTNSRIDHAVSRTGPTGPFEFRDVAIPTWSHNSAPLALPNNKFAIFHIGAGDGPINGGVNCSNESSRFHAQSPTLTRSRHGFASGIHVSLSLDGPWEPLETNLGACNNPAAWIHPNGTIYVGCQGSLKRSDRIEGPYVEISRFPTGGGPPGHYEDPQLYTDARGHFHCFYHVYITNLPSFDCIESTVSAHAYSLDGYEWHVSKLQPYDTQLKMVTGETITLATRERPKPLFDEKGVMTHLIQGVCGSPFCSTPATNAGCVDCKYKQWDFTLVVPLDLEGNM